MFEHAAPLQRAASSAEARLHQGAGRVIEVVGGPARLRAISVLAAVKIVDSADIGMVGTMAAQLEVAFHVGNTAIGLLVTVAGLTGAIATLPFGVLTDRINRSRLLQLSVVTWGAAELVSGLSTSFTMLLLARVFLGVLTATQQPAVASMTGDLFPAGERSRIYGWILAGEVVGTGFGIVLASLFGGWFGWRGAFLVLTVPSVLLWWMLRHWLPEPARGGQSWLSEGAQEIPPAEAVQDQPAPEAHPDEHRQEAVVVEQVEAEGVEPDPELVPDEDPERMSLWKMLRYVVRIRTNLLLIVASSLGYFFFGGLRTFAILFIRGRFDVSQGAATGLVIVVGAGVVAGVLLGGRLADRFLHQGRLTARIVVGAVGYIVAAVVLVPGVLVPTLAVAALLYAAAGVALGAPNPPLDAARLDVVGSRLWGRAESARTFLRSLLEAFAPLLFGYLSSLLGGSRATLGGGADVTHALVHSGQVQGLGWTFLIMLGPLLVSGLLMLQARHSYPTDVASAAAYDRRTVGVGDRHTAGVGGGRPAPSHHQGGERPDPTMGTGDL